MDPLRLMNPTSPRRQWIVLRELKRGCDLGHSVVRSCLSQKILQMCDPLVTFISFRSTVNVNIKISSAFLCFLGVRPHFDNGFQARLFMHGSFVGKAALGGIACLGVAATAPVVAQEFQVRAINSITCENADGFCKAYVFEKNSIGQIVRANSPALVFGDPGYGGAATSRLQPPRYANGTAIDSRAWTTFLRGFGPRSDGRYSHVLCVKTRDLGFNSGLNGNQVQMLTIRNSLLASARAVGPYQGSGIPLCKAPSDR